MKNSARNSVLSISLLAASTVVVASGEPTEIPGSGGVALDISDSALWANHPVKKSEIPASLKPESTMAQEGVVVDINDSNLWGNNPFEKKEIAAALRSRSAVVQESDGVTSVQQRQLRRQRSEL